MQWSEWLRRAASAAPLCAVLLAAFLARAWSVSAGVPHAVGIDEPAIIDRALRILTTGDWNPHVFDYPTLVIYAQTLLAIVVFLGGAVSGAWTGLHTLDITPIYVAARLFTAAIGVLTVYLTYRIGDAMAGRALGLLAAAQLALLPMHVRESHFALTDVPVTALTTLGVWLSMRAASVRTGGAYAAAGTACGLAAAAKYNGIVACVAPAIAWLASDSAAADRGRKAAAAAAAAAAAFLLAVPYAALDLPAFLTGFAAQAARFSTAQAGVDPSWLVYLKHLALMGGFWLPAAVTGLVIVLMRRPMRSRALPMLGFGAAYFYTLAKHSIVFARYALPLLPIVCVLAAVPVIEVARALKRFGRPRAAKWAVAAGAVALTVVFASQTARWLQQFAAPDTRQMAAEWMTANLPRGARVVVENSGPTYLRVRGFDVVPVELVLEQSVASYRELGATCLVISSRDLERNREYLTAGPIVFEATPSARRWGPPIRIVRLEPQ